MTPPFAAGPIPQKADEYPRIPRSQREGDRMREGISEGCFPRLDRPDQPAENTERDQRFKSDATDYQPDGEQRARHYTDGIEACGPGSLSFFRTGRDGMFRHSRLVPF